MSLPLKADARSRRAYARTPKGGWKEVALTAKEFDVLHILLQHPGHALDRHMLLERVWDKDLGAVNPEAVDRCVANLRKKLGAPGRLIKTLRGRGYGLEP